MPLEREQKIIDSGKSITASKKISTPSPRASYVGIVPADGLKSTFDFSFPPCLLPVGKNINLLQAAVMDCMWFKCRQIYVVGHRENLKLYKKCLGEYVRLPQGIYAQMSGFYAPQHHVPIYYVPIHPKDRKKRDSLAWSVLYGCISHRRVVKLLSQHMHRDGFFVSFPFGIYSPYHVDTFRGKVTKRNNFFFNYEGKTVRDGLMLPFYFNGKEFHRLFKNVRKKMIEDGFFRDENVRNEYTVKDVFGLIPPHEEDVSPYLTTFHEITSWENYQDFLVEYKEKNYSLVKTPLIKPKRTIKTLF